MAAGFGGCATKGCLKQRNGTFARKYKRNSDNFKTTVFYHDVEPFTMYDDAATLENGKAEVKTLINELLTITDKELKKLDHGQCG